MSWPLVFIRFLLASTARIEDNGGPYEQLLCRMLGEGTGDAYQELADAGCGCPVRPPADYIPTFDPEAAVTVGWEEDHDENTAITYSFEKEWDGDAPGLHQLYEPAGDECESLWGQLDDTQRRQFMTRYWSLETSSPGKSTLTKYHEEGNDCNILPDDELHDGEYKRWLPLRRSITAPASISSLVEADGKPWEIKASTFYYDLGTMKADVKNTLPYLHVPPSQESPGGFPAERRVQVHVVAPLKREKRADDEHHGVPPAQNMQLHKGLRLIQLFFSDFMFLRLGFTSGPKGEMCSGLGGSFKCDVFTDRHNHVIETQNADLAWESQKPIRENKFTIIGIRDEQTYGGGAEEGCSGDCSTPLRVGFEIRKSASFEAAVNTATAIARALSSMTADGVTRVGITEERSIDIDRVREFAKSYRMPLRVPWRRRDTRSRLSQWMERRKGDTLLTPTHPFCTSEVQDDGNDGWRDTVTKLALHLYTDVGGNAVPDEHYHRDSLAAQLWKMLALLLCSDWTKLVDTNVLPGNVSQSLPDTSFLHVAFKQLNAENTRDDLERFRVMVAEYAFRLSQYF